MYIGIYINGDLYSRSNDLVNAKMNAISYLNKKWEEVKDDIFITPNDYIKALTDITNGEDTKFTDEIITFREVDEKMYSITYTETYEKCEETINADYCSFQKKYVIEEEKLNSFISSFREELEEQVEGTGVFNDMAEKGYVEVLQDTEWVYEVYAKPTHKYYIVEVKELS